MTKIIRLTEQQLKEIEESTFDNGIDTPNPIPEVPQGQISAAGKKDVEDYSNPVTTGDIANIAPTKSFPWGGGAYYHTTHVPMVAEGINAEKDGEIKDGVDQFYNHPLTNELVDGNEEDDQEVIPHSIEMHLDRLIDAIKQSNLPELKQMAILNKLIANTDMQNIQPSVRKESMLKIGNK